MNKSSPTLLKKISADAKRPVFSKLQGSGVPPIQRPTAIVVGATVVDVVVAMEFVVVVVAAFVALVKPSVRLTASNIVRTA